MTLGWLSPTVVEAGDAGTYTLCGIGDNQEMLKITAGFDSSDVRVVAMYCWFVNGESRHVRRIYRLR